MNVHIIDWLIICSRWSRACSKRSTCIKPHSTSRSICCWSSLASCSYYTCSSSSFASARETQNRCKASAPKKWTTSTTSSTSRRTPRRLSWNCRSQNSTNSISENAKTPTLATIAIRKKWRKSCSAMTATSNRRTNTSEKLVIIN